MEGLTPSKTGKECYEREEEEKLPSGPPERFNSYGMEQCETIHQDEAQLVRTSLERMMNLM